MWITSRINGKGPTDAHRWAGSLFGHLTTTRYQEALALRHPTYAKRLESDRQNSRLVSTPGLVRAEPPP